MARAPKTGFLLGLLLASAAVEPAHAFSLFGFHLWGEREEEDQIEIIDPLPYTVTFNITGVSGGTERAVRDASSLWSDRETPASGVGGLLSKARGDYRRLLAALYSAGFYGPQISIRAAGQEVADLTLAVSLPPDVPMTDRRRGGAALQLRADRHRQRSPPTAEMDDEVDTPESIGFKPGERAFSRVINQASALSIERWRELSYAKAREADREVTADHARDLLDVTLTLDPGRAARYGDIRTTGSRRTDPDFILYMSGLKPGEPFDPDDIDAAQTRLTSLQVFRSLRFVEGEEIAPDGTLPIDIIVEDRRPRTVGVGATLSTIDGVGVTAFWVHRNLFGRGEQLRFDAGVDGLGGSLNPDDYDYNLGVTFTKPGVFNPDTSFITSLIGQRVDYDTYNERSVTAQAGFSRTFGRDITGSIFGVASRARYEDDFGVRSFTLLGLNGAAQLDRRDDPLDATRGYYLAATAMPLYDFEYGNPMAQTTIEGRVYKGFGEERHGRARRAAQGRELLRPRRGGEPAGPAVLRRRRRLGPRLSLPLDRRRDGGHPRRFRLRDLHGRRRRPHRGVGRGALPHQRALRRGRLRRLGLRHRDRELRRRQHLQDRRRASARATSPASACCASTSPRRSSPIRTIPGSPSTSA